MGINHIENLKPLALLKFVTSWNTNNTEFSVTEKIDGFFMAFGQTDGQFYVRTKNKKFYSADRISNAYYMADFKRYFTAFQKLNIPHTLSELGFDTDTWEFQGEMVSSYDHNIVLYDKEKVGSGLYVVFGCSLIEDNEVWEQICDKLNVNSEIKFMPVPEVDVSHFKFPEILIQELTQIIENNSGILFKPARRPDIKLLKRSLLGDIRLIALEFKKDFLDEKIETSLGDEYEGLVFAHPDQKPVKLVDADKFKKRKDDNWAIINSLKFLDKNYIEYFQDAQARSRTAQEKIGIINNWERDIKLAEENFKIQMEYMDIPKKIEDTKQNFKISKEHLENAKRTLT